MDIPYRQIRADYTATSIKVYQAYAPQIAGPAVRRGRFPGSWSRTRMTWIKPSFLWMMYRSGWGTKPGQERVIALELHRDGFDWCLEHSCLSHYEPGTYATREAWAERLQHSPVRIQWDPERDISLNPLPYRSLQMGLSKEAVPLFADEWIVSITDVTELAHRVRDVVRAGSTDEATALLPRERPYPLASSAARVIGVPS